MSGVSVKTSVTVGTWQRTWAGNQRSAWVHPPRRAAASSPPEPWSWSFEVIVEPERAPFAEARLEAAVATEPLQFTGAGARDHEPLRVHFFALGGAARLQQ